jgi:hypothetical protein
VAIAVANPLMRFRGVHDLRRVASWSGPPPSGNATTVGDAVVVVRVRLGVSARMDQVEMRQGGSCLLSCGAFQLALRARSVDVATGASWDYEMDRWRAQSPFGSRAHADRRARRR